MKKLSSHPAAANVRLPAKIFSRLFAAGALCFFAAGVAPAQIPPRNDSERELFELLNRERSAHNLPELNGDEALFKAARRHELLTLNLNILQPQRSGAPGHEESLAQSR